MTILIDGYNLLFAVGMQGRHVGPGSLEHGRSALLNFLAASLDDSERNRTTVVFDAQSAPPGLPREQTVRGILVLFSVGYENADALVQELILADSAPRQLVVVSSDHEIQRAARRRRATAADSDRWYDDLVRRRQRATNPPDHDHDHDKPETPTSEEMQFWLKAFSEDRDVLPASPASEPNNQAQAQDQHPKRADKNTVDERDVDKREVGEDLLNPFPPGYAEDLLDEQ